MYRPEDERVFAADGHPIRYLIREGTSDHLLVVFSGFHAANHPRYNYIRHLEGVPPHRMYVLDDLGPRGSYYLGADRDLFIARGVQAAIEAELERLGLDRSALILAGSSKGGSAAVYFGSLLGARVLAGAPQYRIGSFLNSESAATAVCKLISGDNQPADVEWLNGVLGEAIDRGVASTEFEIFSSKRDAQFALHVRPMLKRIEQAGLESSLTLGDYSPHASVFTQFAPWMRDRALEIGFSGAEAGRSRSGSAERRLTLWNLAVADNPLTAEQLTALTRLELDQVAAELGALGSDKLARRTRSRKWVATKRGREHVGI